MFKRLLVWDLDETIIDSKHRTPNNPDGTLNLQRYFELKTRENIFRDSLLPLASVFKSLCRVQNYIAICTARVMNQDDYDFLDANGISAHSILCRPENGSENKIPDAELKAIKIQRLWLENDFHKLPTYMWDDSKPVISKMRQIGVRCINAKTVNERMKRA